MRRKDPLKQVAADMHGSTLVLVSLLTSVLTTTGTTYLLQRYDVLPHAPQVEVVVPQLVGLSEADARANARTLELAVLVAGREATTDASTGTVLRQSIAPGSRVPPDYALSVVIAQAPPTVPSVAGLSVAAATERLKQHGYTIDVGTAVADGNVAAGSIVSQAPAADAPLAKGGVVVVHASSGPAEVVVPKLIGLKMEAATEKIEELGLKPATKWLSLAETVSHVVLKQEPSPGQPLKPGEEVALFVNR
jgi:eukaryotic-like serine/threonine-protein kinase